MRLWTLHPRYLDARGLVALWREALLAQKVLRGKTRGYRAHPQLARFRGQDDPVAAIAAYLAAVWAEADSRGYAFDASKIGRRREAPRIPETRGQMQYEREHLLGKLRVRDPVRGRQLARIKQPDAHPLFRPVRGGVRDWEKRDGPGAGSRRSDTRGV